MGKKCGKPVFFANLAEADQFCLMGAIIHLNLTPDSSFYKFFPEWIVNFNDSHSWSDVRSILLSIIES